MVGIPGDPGAVEAAAEQLAAAGEQFVDARDSIAAHGRSITAEWTGLASVMALAALEEYASKTLVGADVCRDAAPVLRTFAAQLRAAQQQYADAEARLAGGQAQIDRAAPGAAGDAARAQGQAVVAEAAGAMNAALLRVQQANEAAATQIDALFGQLAEMQGSDPDVLGDEGGHQLRSAPPEDDGGFSLSDIAHTALDGLGLVPVIGEPADAINAIWYGLEGDWTNAALSGGSMIPVAGVVFSGGRLVGKGVDAARAADGALELPSSQTWGNATTLGDHFQRHGADFGVASADEYASQASQFYQRGLQEGMPTKIDPDTGVTRIYDPSSNTFGAYNPDGTTRTFYKPDPERHGYDNSWSYWVAQPGYMP